MGTVVEGVAVVEGGWRSRLGRGALALSDSAARACLARALLQPDDLDLLVNAGLYHDRALGEPALAALIQDDIGANPEDPHEDGHGTFSFDVANGACGLLTGLRVAHGFLAAGTIDHALVVAGDADPGRRLARRFPYSPVAGAIACGWYEGPGGLVGFHFANRPEGGELFRAEVGFERGHNRLRIHEAPGFAAEAAGLAGEVATRLLADHGLAPGDVDLVVANPLTGTFLAGLGAHLGLDDARLVAPRRPVRAHTAGLAVAWDEARRQGRLDGGATILLVSAAAGLTAGAALMRPTER